jgi:hypothetical protein
MAYAACDMPSPIQLFALPEKRVFTKQGQIAGCDNSENGMG